MAKDTIKMQELGVTEYAKTVGISRQAVHKQIDQDKLPEGVTARKVGRYYIITVIPQKNAANKRKSSK